MAIRVEDARVTGLYYVRNPEKLSRVESETALTLRCQVPRAWSRARREPGQARDERRSLAGGS